MATINKTPDQEYADAFSEDTPSAPMQDENDAFGLTPQPEAGADTPAAEAAEGEPSAVAVVVAEPDDSTPEAQAAGDAAAQQSADQANEQANAGASATERGSSPAVEEAAAGSGEGPGADGTPAHEAGESAATEAAEQAAGGLDDLSDVPPEDMQKAKSWQGRLKKLEADLKEKLASSGQPADAAGGTEKAADSLEAVADQNVSANPQMADAASDAADAVASGDMTPEQAIAQLSEDFGEPFLKAIEAVVTKMFGDKLGQVQQDTESIIEHLTNSQQRAHFEQIYAAHPDFMDIAKDPAFQAFVQAQGAQDVVDSGSAQAINQLIGQFKAQAQAPAAPDAGAPADTQLAQADTGAPAAATAAAAPAQPDTSEASPDELDAAEGVRSSGGLRLPEPPKKGGSFEDAWSQF